MQDLKITLVQANLIWENADQNRRHFEGLLKNISNTDLILLPEMFSTGFSMNTKSLAEYMEGNTVNWMKKMAAEKNAVIAGSLIIEDNEAYYNRLIWAEPDGSIMTYDKRHLFSLAGEEKFYRPGHKKIFPEINEWKILPLICYDLRFPVWARQSPPYTEMGMHPYDLLIYVASWPEKRIYAWKQLLIARAIENQSYVIGLNRVGNDGNDFNYPGQTCLIDPMGEVILNMGETESVKTITISQELIADIRSKFKFLDDRDEFELKM